MDKSKLLQSTKWSVITELLAKIMTPLCNIVLARLLLPEVFGVVATLTMVTTFAEVFTDAGFQKYLVQHEFRDVEERNKYANVAFWTNLGFSMFLWLLICLFRDTIAKFAGSPGYGVEVSVLSMQIPLVAFSSIQTALYRREFLFKELMPIRIITSLTPVFVTVPLALVFKNCWAVIIGNLVKETINAVLLTRRSTWKPSFFYDLSILKTMLSSSLWMMADSLLIWMTSYVDTFIVSRYLNSHYIGIYKQGATTINPYITLLYTMTAPVLFSALSRLQNDKTECDKTLLSFQRYASYFVLPFGLGIFVFHDFVTGVLLGKNFMEASLLLGIIGMSLSLNMLTAQYNSDYFRAVGRPKVALAVQASYVLVLVLGLSFAARQSFSFLCASRGLFSLSYAIISCSVLHVVFHVKVGEILKNLFPAGCAAMVMAVFSYFFRRLNTGMVWQLVAVAASVVIYFGMLGLTPGAKKDAGTVLNLIKNRRHPASIKGE